MMIDIVERLRLADSRPATVKSWRDFAGEAADEIERLRADKAAISQTASDYLHKIERLRHIYEAAKADANRAIELQRLEIERLKEGSADFHSKAILETRKRMQLEAELGRLTEPSANAQVKRASEVDEKQGKR